MLEKECFEWSHVLLSLSTSLITERRLTFELCLGVSSNSAVCKHVAKFLPRSIEAEIILQMC